MATSGTISATMTARQVCQDALELLSAYGANETMTASDGALALRRLNNMLKSWQTDGVNLWRETQRSFVTVPGVTSYVLTPRPLDVEEARLLDSTYQRTLGRWELGQYANLPNKAALGIPTIYNIDRQRDDVIMTLWPVPNEVLTVYYTADRVIEDVTDLDQNLDVPQEWLECVCYNLATKLYPSFGNAPRYPEVKEEAQRLYGLLRDFDRPSSYYMGSYRSILR